MEQNDKVDQSLIGFTSDGRVGVFLTHDSEGKEIKRELPASSVKEESEDVEIAASGVAVIGAEQGLVKPRGKVTFVEVPVKQSGSTESASIGGPTSADGVQVTMEPNHAMGPQPSFGYSRFQDEPRQNEPRASQVTDPSAWMGLITQIYDRMRNRRDHSPYTCILVSFLLLTVLMLGVLLGLTFSSHPALKSMQDEPGVSLKLLGAVSKALRFSCQSANATEVSEAKLLEVISEITSNENDIKSSGRPEVGTEAREEEVSTPDSAEASTEPSSVMEVQFSRFECHDLQNCSLCVSPISKKCVVVLSSAPVGRVIRVVPLDRELSFESETEKRFYERRCLSPQDVYRYVPF